ncbi:MAG: SDR family NAD(P)-dependent oxidoreductase [Galbitalea sp.]
MTGAGRGLGREHALELARRGARVVVNDLGTSLAGEGVSTGPADEVVELIRAAGGEAVSNGADVADFEQARAMIRQAVDTFGGLDILVNNAGFVRDRMLVNISEDEWMPWCVSTSRGTSRPCATRANTGGARPKTGGCRRLVSSTPHREPASRAASATASYSAAKAAITGLTIVAAQELGRYGVTVNAIAPSARTRMTEGPFAEAMATTGGRVRPHASGQRVADRRLAGQRGRRGTSPVG